MAAGWDGDRYAIFENRRTGEPLMLMHTSWDTDADAREFAQAYRRVLETKYSVHPTPTTLREKGRDVLVVEGADDQFAAALMAFLEGARKTRKE